MSTTHQCDTWALAHDAIDGSAYHVVMRKAWDSKGGAW